eukprot:SM003608S13729  [mRNA]  locus=s3608:1253:1351:- [translate_table: standard]
MSRSPRCRHPTGLPSSRWCAPSLRLASRRPRT